MIWPHPQLSLDLEVYADRHAEMLEELEDEHAQVLEDQAEREAWDEWADEEIERHRDQPERSHVIKLEWPVIHDGGDAA